MSVTASRVFSDRLRLDQYQCQRCGCVLTFSQARDRPKPTTCRDCRDVESLRVASGFVGETWQPLSEAVPGGNPVRPLTTPLASTERQAAMQATQICSVPDCERAACKREWCNACYQRLLRWGEIERLSIRSPAERLAAGLVRMPNGCLEWTNAISDTGYGHIRVDGTGMSTHRLAWTLANGPIPEGLYVLHYCDNRPCCETEPTECYPDGHLFLGTHAENMADMAAKGRSGNRESAKTHCPANHAYDEANTYVDRRGWRKCRACQSEGYPNARAGVAS